MSGLFLLGEGLNWGPVAFLLEVGLMEENTIFFLSQIYVLLFPIILCNPASGGTFSSTAIEIIKWVNFFALAQVKVSHILRPGNTAFNEQLKLFNGFER
jgi:hypothetical protein